MGSAVSCPTISKEEAILEAKDLGIDWTEFDDKRWERLEDAEGKVAVDVLRDKVLRHAFECDESHDGKTEEVRAPAIVDDAAVAREMETLEVDLGEHLTAIDGADARSKHVKCMEGFFQLCSTNKRLVEVAEAVEHESLTDAEKAARQRARWKKMRAKAEEAMKAYANMSDAEKLELHNTGDMDMYTDRNMALREQLRDEPRICRALDRWWRAVVAHDDRDKDQSLDRAEYAAFYTRLAKMADPDDEMSPAEIQEAMEADFVADSGADECVTKDEFLNSIFELADQWTTTTHAEEYLEFLNDGYAKMFHDLDEADELQFPEEWRPHLRSGTQITAMPRKVASEFVVYVLSLFFTQNASFSLPAFVVHELEAFFSTKNKKQFKKKMKAFTKALATATRYESHDDFLSLFARLCGCYTMSGPASCGRDDFRELLTGKTMRNRHRHAW